MVQVLVAGKLAKALKPHQWEGVRFMWQNVVEGRVSASLIYPANLPPYTLITRLGGTWMALYSLRSHIICYFYYPRLIQPES